MPRNYVRNSIGEFATTSGGASSSLADAFKPRPEGKHTAASVAKQMADPSRPIQAAPPTPPTYTASTFPGGRAAFMQHVKNGPSEAEQKQWDAFHAALRNDPAVHANRARSLNEDRASRRREAKAGD